MSASESLTCWSVEALSSKSLTNLKHRKMHLVSYSTKRVRVILSLTAFKAQHQAKNLMRFTRRMQNFQM